MNTLRKSLFVLSLIVVLAALAVPAFAQDTAYSVTEDEINDSYFVTNPPRRTISDLAVDLQPGEVDVTFAYALRGREARRVEMTLLPVVENGRLFWSIDSVTVDGEPASSSVLRQINAVIETAWRNYIKRNGPAGAVTGIEITDSEIRLTVRR